jgi:hypothetical protein
VARKNDEAWAEYISEKRFSLDGRQYRIDAEDLKQVTKREPRLLAKFDTKEEMPAVLRDNGYALLPITNGEYLLFPGDIFQELKPCADREQFIPHLPFHLETAGRGIGEMQYLDHAFNTGMLPAFVGAQPLFLTIRGRERSNDFTFTVAGQKVEVSGVQVEVDGGYEGPHDIILVEAKIGLRNYFNIRQLFYPYRRFLALVPRKRIRPIFFVYDFSEAVYSFYEFEVRNPDEFGSLALVRSWAFTLPPAKRLKIEQLEDVRYETPQSEGRLVPQADDLNKILELLMAIDEGYTGPDDLALYFGFDRRQSDYYAEAAEYLGLVSRGRGIVSLSPRGTEFIQLSLEEKPEYVARLIVNSWVFKAANDKARRSGHFSTTDIEQIIAATEKPTGSARYSGSTLGRRVRTIVAWVKWLAGHVGCYSVEPGTQDVFTLR